jgi:hypothetical protein
MLNATNYNYRTMIILPKEYLLQFAIMAALYNGMQGRKIRPIMSDDKFLGLFHQIFITCRFELQCKGCHSTNKAALWYIFGRGATIIIIGCLQEILYPQVMSGWGCR